MPRHHTRRRRGLSGGVAASPGPLVLAALLCATVLAACGDDAPAPVEVEVEEEAAPPPPPDPVPLAATLEVGWEEREGLAAQARTALDEQRLRLGLSRVSDVEVQVACKQKRCTAEVTGQGWP